MISNYELTEPINLIGLITSKKNTIRANHYHPVQEQKCLLIKGQYISVYQDLLEKNAPKITHIVNAGDLIVTRPNVAHTMVFTQDSIFLNLVRGEREHENYGITHNEYLKMVKAQNNLCAICGCEPPNNHKKRLNIDNCHTTEKVRGLLCDACNRAIGLMKDNPDLLNKAINYLAR